MKKCVVVLLLIFGIALQAWGQVVGASITGAVKDASGAGLPEALVTITNTETGAERKLVTDDAGRYSAPSVPVGPYQVLAEKVGFSSQVRTGITLAVGQRSVVDITLPVGELRQILT